MQTNVLKKPIYIAEIDCAISSYTGQILNGLFLLLALLLCYTYIYRI